MTNCLHQQTMEEHWIRVSNMKQCNNVELRLKYLAITMLYICILSMGVAKYYNTPLWETIICVSDEHIMVFESQLKRFPNCFVLFCLLPQDISRN